MHITIVMPLVRIWMLDEMAKQIRQEHHPNLDIQIVVICDNLEIKQHQIEDSFHGLNTKIVYTGREPSPELNIKARRQHITDAYNLSRNYIRPEDQYVWTLEDDTIIPQGTLNRLISHMTTKTGIVSGVQPGRHGFKIIGAWTTPLPLDIQHKRNYPEPTIYETVPYQKHGTQYVQATGLYCMLTQAHLYRTTTFRHDHLGPDFYYGYDLFRKNYYILIDHDIPCGHKTQNTTLWPDQQCITTRWTVQPNGELWPEIL